jgi:hypothetical protein
MFHIDWLLKNGECHVRTTKTGRKVYTWIPEWLRERIRARVAKCGPLIFGAHETCGYQRHHRPVAPET